ncbi:hypothetical protein EV13_2508 [Prochlorococcus sp. MIT 0702]|nr:hypothetical protein EV12_2295 [Prochlorococcus sp. MIT 0701]KGG26374.1 hypothetical protein EV13_2508 [Prochlorococcus sp. MIT 0702]KGG31206.1 hypothetical protein EV14_2577 [Prochlorococcus sp. MIT 0703]
MAKIQDWLNIKFRLSGNPVTEHQCKLFKPGHLDLWNQFRLFQADQLDGSES